MANDVTVLVADPPRIAALRDEFHPLAIPGSSIQQVARDAGTWTVTPFAVQPALASAPVALNTRRTPRFAVLDRLQAVVDGNMTNLVDVSVLGAQVVSTPRLMPNQRITITLPDGSHELKLAAHIAWSMFEKPKATIDPYYRAGMEFSEATLQALDEYCRRHCRAVDS